MRLGVPVFCGRVSPVFDVARRLLLIEVIAGKAAFEEEHGVQGMDRVHALIELGVDIVICGAVSRELEERLLANGIEVVAEIRGPVREVVRAYLEGTHAQPGFSMPGCHSRRRHPRRRTLVEAGTEGPRRAGSD
jgi:predicted Fe-Mo cluster-binding NifX family protein